MIENILTHIEDTMSFMVVHETGAEEWYALSEVQHTPAFRSYLSSLGEERSQRVTQAINSLKEPTVTPPSAPAPPKEPTPPPTPQDIPAPIPEATTAPESITNQEKTGENDLAEGEEFIPEEEEVKPKRGRGRPPKPKTSTDSTQPKRGRGRPPKKKPLGEEKPKRPRGRPPKNRDSLEQVPATTPTDSPVVADPPKRGRGRPRKRPLSVEPDGKPKVKRGRGRPRKVQRTDSVSSADGPTKRGRGRPRKHFPLETTSEDPDPVQRDPNCDDISDSDSEMFSYSDSDETEYPYFDHMEEMITPISAQDRFRKIFRPMRADKALKTSKILIPETRISVPQILPNLPTEQQNRAWHAMKCFLPVSELIRLVEETQEILCLLCGRRSCHSRCAIRIPTTSIRSTYQWMNQVNWNNQSFSLPSVVKPSTDPSAVTKYLQHHMNTMPSPLSSMVGAPIIVQSIGENQTRLLRLVADLADKVSVHPARLQRAAYRLLMLQFEDMIPDDLFLAMKLTRLLFVRHYTPVEVLQGWKLLVFNSPAEIPSAVPTSQTLTNLMNLANFTRSIYQSLGLQMEREISSPLVSDDATAEQKANEWGINTAYVEDASASPLPHDNRCALYCTLPCDRHPTMVMRVLMERIEKQLQLSVDEEQEYKETSPTEKDKAIASFKAFSSSRDVRIQWTIDNWPDQGYMHFFIRIMSPTLIETVNAVKNEIAVLFHLDDMDRHSSTLWYQQTKEILEGHSPIELEFTTGEGDAVNSQFAFLKHPSTLCVGRCNGEEVVRLLLTYSHAMETMQHGPTIQYLAVKQTHRRQDIGTRIIQHLISRFLQFWRPSARHYYLFASFVTNAHSFWNKLGFQFYDQLEEECAKLVERSAIDERPKTRTNQPPPTRFDEEDDLNDSFYRSSDDEMDVG